MTRTVMHLRVFLNRVMWFICIMIECMGDIKGEKCKVVVFFSLIGQASRWPAKQPCTSNNRWHYALAPSSETVFLFLPDAEDIFFITKHCAICWSSADWQQKKSSLFFKKTNPPICVTCLSFKTSEKGWEIPWDDSLFLNNLQHCLDVSIGNSKAKQFHRNCTLTIELPTHSTPDSKGYRLHKRSCTKRVKLDVYFQLAM